MKGDLQRMTMEFNIDSINWYKIFDEILKEKLSVSQEPFENESELQLELTQKLTENYHHVKVFLEGIIYSKSFSENKSLHKLTNKRIDISILHQNSVYPIELKYRYRNNTPGGQNNLQYDYLYDIYKIEQLQNLESYQTGYCLFLTNMTCLYNKPNKNRKEKCNCENYRIFDGRKLKKECNYKWLKNGKEVDGSEMNSFKNRKTILKFKNDYELKWSEEFRISHKGFKLLAIKIPKEPKI